MDTASDFTGQWQLKFLDVDGRVYRPSAVWQPRLDIPSDPIGWSGDNGCNRFRYTVNLSDTNLIAVYQTTRGCPAVEELAALFMDTLEVAATAIVSDGDLIVEGSRGRLIFVPFGGPEGP